MTLPFLSFFLEANATARIAPDIRRSAVRGFPLALLVVGELGGACSLALSVPKTAGIFAVVVFGARPANPRFGLACLVAAASLAIAILCARSAHQLPFIELSTPEWLIPLSPC